MMRLVLLLVFFAYPLLELALLIHVGGVIGFWPLLGLIVATGILGISILRRQGFKVVETVSAALNEGAEPVAPLADSALIFTAGAFLVSPGLIGDVMGLLLLLPPVRSLVRAAIAANFLGSSTVVFHRGPPPRSGAEAPRPPVQGKVIEGEWERVDEDPREQP